MHLPFSRVGTWLHDAEFQSDQDFMDLTNFFHHPCVHLEAWVRAPANAARPSRCPWPHHQLKSNNMLGLVLYPAILLWFLSRKECDSPGPPQLSQYPSQHNRATCPQPMDGAVVRSRPLTLRQEIRARASGAITRHNSIIEPTSPALQFPKA